MDDNINAIQVIQELDDNTIRVYKVTQAHLGTDDDPLTTITIDGTFQDVDIRADIR